MKTIKAGSIIYCWQCLDKIASVEKDLKFGQRIDASNFKGIQKPIKNGSMMLCNCGAALLTEKGFCTFGDL